MNERHSPQSSGELEIRYLRFNIHASYFHSVCFPLTDPVFFPFSFLHFTLYISISLSISLSFLLSLCLCFSVCLSVCLSPLYSFTPLSPLYIRASYSPSSFSFLLTKCLYV